MQVMVATIYLPTQQVMVATLYLPTQQVMVATIYLPTQQVMVATIYLPTQHAGLRFLRGGGCLLLFLHNVSNFHSDFETLSEKMGGGIGISPGPQLTWMG
jgi:hypothetical protein